MSAKTTAVAVMGGCDMDLRRAEIEGPEVLITAVAFWGGITVTVPEGFDVEMQGLSIMGGRDLRLRDVARVPGSPRIVVRGYSIMGGIEVRSRPNRSGRQVARAVSHGVQGVMDALSVGGPVDLATLRTDLTREMRAQRRAGSDDGGGSPPAAVPLNDGTVTVMFCDMVDYAGMTERLGDHASRELLREHHLIVRSAVERHGGREVNVQGDGFMVAFGGVARALRCAIDVQRSFAGHGPSADGERLAVHIGVHTGDALAEGDDFLGHTVIVASRLADAAAPGEILVSSLSEQLVQGSGEFAFDGHRETRLKGMTRAQLSATLSWA